MHMRYVRKTLAKRVSYVRTVLSRMTRGKSSSLSWRSTTSFFQAARNEHADFAPYDEYDAKFLRGVRKLRNYLYYLFHDETYNKTSLFVLIFILAIIILSTLFYILETVPALSEKKIQRDFWEISELIVTVIFTIEYLIRITVVKNRLRYFLKPMNVVDLLAVLPWYVEIVLPQLPSTSLRVLRIVRLARLGRLRNLFSEYIEVMTRALWNAAEEAGPMMLLMVSVEVVLFGACSYAFENGYHEDGTFASIPDTMWWAFVTMTTVGYGDLSPVTNLGRLLGVFCMFSGIVLMAICVIIIGGNFEQVQQAVQSEKLAKVQKERLEAQKAKEEIAKSNASKNSLRLSQRNSNVLVRSLTTSSRLKRQQMQNAVDNLEGRLGKMEERLKAVVHARRSLVSIKKKMNYPWLRRRNIFITDVVVQNMMECFTDDDQFQLRSVNLSFYNAYFCTVVRDFNTMLNVPRVIKLAAHGRIFQTVKILIIRCGTFPASMLRFITATYFPKLVTIQATIGTHKALW